MWTRKGSEGTKNGFGWEEPQRGAVGKCRCLLSPSGKSMLLSAIGKREVPIPEHIDIYHLTREMPPSDKTPLQCVMEVDTERAMLEKEAERLAHEDGRAVGLEAGGGRLPSEPGPGRLMALCCPQRSVRSSWSSTSAWRSWMLTRRR